MDVQVAVGSTTTYKASDMCGVPANDTGFVDPGEASEHLTQYLKGIHTTVLITLYETLCACAGTLNYVKLTGLKPDTIYYYVYGDVVSSHCPATWTIHMQQDYITTLSDNVHCWMCRRRWALVSS